MNRKITREEAIKILYSMDIANCYDSKIIDEYINHFTEEAGNEDYKFSIEALDKEYLYKTIEDVIDNLDIIDKKIIDNSKGWKINRIAKVDLAILRVAIAEIIYNSSIPGSVSINEAVEISKRYSVDDSHKYINGVLGSVYRGLQQWKNMY